MSERMSTFFWTIVSLQIHPLTCYTRIMSTLSPSEIAYEKAHINQTRQPACYGVVITFYIMAIVMVGLRMAARRLQRTRPSLDDYLSVAGIIFMIPFMSATLGGL